MKKSLLYTRGGDTGTTSLVGGQRVAKTHPRLDAYGNIDELNSFIGLLIAETELPQVVEILQFVQHKLFTVGSYLATDTSTTALHAASYITAKNIERLEQAIDRFDGELPRMTAFILPGGSRAAGLAHVCRTVCRRAERQICRVAEVAEVDPNVSKFVNRLSDLLFAIGRYECHVGEGKEILWDNTCDE